MMRKLSPTPKIAIANLMGVDGAREPSLVHSTAKIGAKIMMKTGLIDWIQLIGTAKAPTLVSVYAETNSLIVDPLWS